MNFEKPINPNYCATVVRIGNTYPLKGFDKLVGTTIFGFNVIISSETSGLGVFFPAETQLSDVYCMENDLYRHADKNRNPDKTGYIEDNRRVKAIKFKGNTSNGFFMPLDSLEFTGINTNFLSEGDEFDLINGYEICRKYTVAHKEFKKQAQADRGFVRADKLYMPEHIDTENFFKNHHKIDGETEVIVTQKLHGTSIRIGHTMVNRKPSVLERIASYLGAKIANTEHVYLYASKKVIKDANNPLQVNYYNTDIWTLEGKKLDGILPENYIVYGELIGWTPDGAEIQKGYTYGLPKGTCKLFIYRIAVVNRKGHFTDLSWEQVKEFCNKNCLNHVPELFKIRMDVLTDHDFTGVKELLDVRYQDKKYLNAIWLGDNELVDEGVCVRGEGLIPKILKAKSPKFFEHETKILDTGVEDLESSQSNDSI